jgi:hypothetical protein
LPLETTLRLSHTRRWASATSPTAPTDFIYTLEANPETWLIAGQRRAHYSAQEDEVIERSILLIPLKTGVTLLPNVEVRKKPGNKEDADLNCETDYLTYGETVTVIPDVRSSTVGVGDMSKGRDGSGAVIWLESAGMVV